MKPVRVATLWGVTLAICGLVHGETTVTRIARLAVDDEIVGVPRQVEFDSDLERLIIATSRATYSLTRSQLQSGGDLVPAAVNGDFTVSHGGEVMAERTAMGWALRDLEGTDLGTTLPFPDSGVRTLESFRRKIVLIGHPMDSPEGVYGRWQWVFMDGAARVATVITNDRPNTVFGPNGKVVVLADRDRVAMYDGDGVKKREVQGHYRHIAVSSRGKVLLLNDANVPTDIVIVRGASVRRVPAHGRVHGLSVSPDGSHAVIWFKKGTMREVNPRTGTLGPAFRIPNIDDAFVSSCHVNNGGLAAAGLLVRSAPGQPYDSGWIMLSKNGAVVANEAYALSALSTRVPEMRPIGRRMLAVRDLEGVSILRIQD